MINGHPNSIGFGACVGGSRPDPPIDAYPLLVWDGSEVKTEDGRATVRDLAMAATGASLSVVANRFGTTIDHVLQAVAYATKS
jgi:hypothetical protein